MWSVLVSHTPVNPVYGLTQQPSIWPTLPIAAGANYLLQGESGPPGSFQAAAELLLLPPVLNSEICLLPGSEPFPAKLVLKVHTGAYIGMKELLGDNISQLNELESANGLQHFADLPGSAR